ncbi:MAG: gliding motility protein GldL [Bacteroidales bacterium]|nr:gliding motility protein GldL [Bacteroidales bacterium]
MSFLDNIVRSKGYKNFMSKLYGWGASVVIVGALFKINHWPGGTIMLIIGMGIEAVIFFLSAFEPLHVEWDWSLVHPELAGMVDGDAEQEKIDKKDKKQLANNSGTVSQQLDNMLSEAKIGPELIESLGRGMQNLADNANSLTNMTTAVAATDKFVSNMDSAANAANDLSEAYKRTAENINQDANLSSSYSESLKEATENVTKLSSIYAETAQTLKMGDSSYVDELKRMATSLSSINAIYEMQIQNAASQMESTKDVQERYRGLVDNFASAAETMVKYRENVEAMNRKMSELNKLYGNILAAMQPKI